MRFNLTCLVLVLAFALWTAPVSANSQREEGRLGNVRRGTGTALPNFSDIQQLTVDAMWEEFIATSPDEGSDSRSRLLLELTETFARQIEDLFYASVSEDWSEEELNEQSHSLEETTTRLTELVNIGTEPPQIKVAPLPAEAVELRIRRLVVLSRRLIPNVLFLAGEDAISLDLLNQVRDDLAITGVLTRALRESGF